MEATLRGAVELGAFASRRAVRWPLSWRTSSEIAMRTLARSGGYKSEAARLLRKDRSTLIRWLSSGTTEHDA